MDIYFSFSPKDNNFFKKEFIRNEFISHYPWIKQMSEAAQKQEKNVYLVTDKNGKKMLEDIQFKEVFVVLDEIDKEYKEQVTSLSKLYAIRYISQKGKPFIHIDNDFLLTRPIPLKIKESKVVLQSIEFEPNKLGYNIEKYNKYCKIKHLISDVQSDISYNCGVIGGTDCEFLYNFADAAIKTVEDPQNKNFWLKKHYGFKSWTKAVLAEQYFISCLLKKEKIEPTLFFDNAFALKDNSSRYNYTPKDSNWFHETGSAHYFGFWKKIESYRYRTGVWPNKFQIFLLKYFG